MPIKPGIYLRGAEKSFFSEQGNEIGERELVYATDTGEIGTYKGWFDPFGPAKGGIGKISYQVDTEDRNFGTSWAQGKIWDNVVFSGGSRIRMDWRVPMRNDSGGWGGGYLGIDYTYNAGEQVNCALFDGNSYIQLDDSHGELKSLFDRDNNNSFTVCIMYKPNSVKQWSRIFNSAGCFSVMFHEDDPFIEILHAPLVGDGNRERIRFSNQYQKYISIGYWNFLCIVRDDGQWRIYNNLVEVPITIDNTGQSDADNRSDTFIGKSERNADELFDGEVSSLEIYNIALSYDEIRELFLKKEHGNSPLKNNNIVCKYLFEGSSNDEMEKHNGIWSGNENYNTVNGIWFNGGNSGYDGPMVTGGDIVTSMSGYKIFLNTPTHDFNFKAVFNHRSYDGTLHINSHRDINYGDNGSFFTNILLTEYLA